MIYKVSNVIENINKLLLELRNDYHDYGFISYIDGEYGLRVGIYNSLCYNFYINCKENKKTVIGICFKGNTSFLNKLCDHIIEIQDITFDTMPNIYQGSDGWNTEYVLGLFCNEYEVMLDKMQFQNEFYTLHSDGSRLINKKNNLVDNTNSFIYAKIDEKDFTIYGDPINWLRINLHISNKEYNKILGGSIAIWIRNTNKWPFRNTPKDIYEHIFNYCIINKKTCYVFMDLIPVEIPKSEYIIDSTVRIKGRPDFDHFLSICDICDYFVGSNSGSSEFVLAYSKTNVKYISSGYFFNSLLNQRMNPNDCILNLNNL